MARADTMDQLSMLKLSESILKDKTNNDPAALSADLTHFRELFSKLKFSYIQQITKEGLLRAIVADPPEFVDAAENLRLEEQLTHEKAALKARKLEVREMIDVLEEQGRQLVRRYEQIQQQNDRLETLPTDIAELEASLALLQANQEPRSSDPELCMPLRPTLTLLQDRQQELSRVDIEIQCLQAAIPAKEAANQRLRDDLEPLQLRKNKAVQDAQEARRRRAQAGGADEAEERARWLKAAKSSLRMMLEV